MKSVAIFFLLLSSVSFAQTQKKSLKNQFESLGDNQIIAERVKNLDSQQKVRVVQNRIVDRNLRLELGLGYGFVGGGDSYVNTQDLNGLAEFHLTPRWSLGVRHQKSYNKLTAEGRNQYDKALTAQKQDVGSNQTFVGLDYPLEATYATLSFYPIYGKLNLFDLSVAHFDVYAIAGYGRMKLSSGESNATTGGGGVGVWLSQRFSTRFELRYQSFKDLIGTENRNQSSFEGMASIGFLL